MLPLATVIEYLPAFLMDSTKFPRLTYSHELSSTSYHTILVRNSRYTIPFTRIPSNWEEYGNARDLAYRRKQIPVEYASRASRKIVAKQLEKS